MRRILTITIAAFLLLTSASVSLAASSPDSQISVGFQHFAPASGFSLRIPLGHGVFVQPIVGLGMRVESDQATGGLAWGARGLYALNRSGWFATPYAGVGMGVSKQYVNNGQATELKYTAGYQAFLGVEYHLFRLAPSIEYGLGYTQSSDGKYFAGSFLNVGLHYYF